MSDLNSGLGKQGSDYGKSDPRPKRDVAFSQVENVYLIRYENINSTGRLFGGQLISWIDEVAGVVAMRHSGLNVTTASIDNLTFKRGAYLNDMVVLIGRMTYVGRTSCEVRVDSYIEDEEGFRREINRAFLTYVAISRDGTPIPIPYGLDVQTISEKARWDGALLRRENRISRKEIGF
ncbi:MAG: acyl-CoA thioesterase [Blautia sp.]|nr:acyl-CoA thioesterase [Blautia sp.]